MNRNLLWFTLTLLCVQCAAQSPHLVVISLITTGAVQVESLDSSVAVTTDSALPLTEDAAELTLSDVVTLSEQSAIGNELARHVEIVATLDIDGDGRQDHLLRPTNGGMCIVVRST